MIRTDWSRLVKTVLLALVVGIGCGGSGEAEVAGQGDAGIPADAPPEAAQEAMEIPEPVDAATSADRSGPQDPGDVTATGASGLSPVESRRPAPAFSLKNLEGETVTLADFAGKVVILDFWATWCPPCKAEIPHFVDLQREYGDRGLQIVGVSLDRQGAQIVRPFADQNRINYVMLVDGFGAARDYGNIQSIPTTFVLDKQGRIVETFVGYTPKATFERLTQQLLSEG